MAGVPRDRVRVLDARLLHVLPRPWSASSSRIGCGLLQPTVDLVSASVRARLQQHPPRSVLDASVASCIFQHPRLRPHQFRDASFVFLCSLSGDPVFESSFLRIKSLPICTDLTRVGPQPTRTSFSVAGVRSLLSVASSSKVRPSSALPGYCFSEYCCKCLNIAKSISFKPYLGIKCILYEILSEKCVESKYSILIPVCISHHVMP
jgi:hypothetical protein